MDNSIMDLIDEVETKYTSSTGSRKLLLISHLESLGYLSFLNINELSLNLQTEKAFHLFYSELLDSKLVRTSEIKQIEKIFGEESHTKLLELALDIDEGLTFSSLPSFGAINLKSRIIHYRLKLLGLYSGEVNSPYSSLSYVGLEKLGSFIDKNKLSAINLVADLQRFTNQYLKINGYKNCLTVFDAPDSLDTDSFPEYSGKFKRTLKKNLSKFPEIFNEIDKKLFYRKDDKVEGQYLQELAQSEFNSFTLRLIQIHQWMGGFYNGNIDDYFGPISLNSLTNIIDTYAEAFDTKVKLEEVLVIIKGDVFLFNSLFFLKQYKEESYANDNSIDTLNIVSQTYNKANENERQSFEQNINTEIESINNSSSQIGNNLTFSKKVFTGIKTFFKKVFKFAGKIFKWIAEQTSKFLDFIKAFIRNLYEYIKLAIRHFLNGIKFLIGKSPIVSQNKNGSYNYTNFDFDKDVISIINSDTGKLEEHVNKAHTLVKSMDFSLEVISLVFGLLRTLLASASAIALPIFLLKLAKSFKLVLDKYKLIVTI